MLIRELLDRLSFLCNKETNSGNQEGVRTGRLVVL